MAQVRQQISRGSKEIIQQVAQILGASQSLASLRQQPVPVLQNTDTMGTLGGQSIEDIKNRELLKDQDQALYRSRTSQHGTLDKPLHLGDETLGSKIGRKRKTADMKAAKHVAYAETVNNYGSNPRAAMNHLNLTGVHSMQSQRSVLLSQYSAPIQEREQEAEQDDDHGADDEEIIVSSQLSLRDLAGPHQQ